MENILSSTNLNENFPLKILVPHQIFYFWNFYFPLKLLPKYRFPPNFCPTSLYFFFDCRQIIFFIGKYLREFGLNSIQTGSQLSVTLIFLFPSCKSRLPFTLQPPSLPHKKNPRRASLSRSSAALPSQNKKTHPLGEKDPFPL